jgi:hypothetical protein
MKERTPDADTLDEIDSTLFLSGLVRGSSADSTVSVGPGETGNGEKGTSADSSHVSLRCASGS